MPMPPRKKSPSSLPAVALLALLGALAACHADEAPPRPLGFDAGASRDAGTDLDAGREMDAGPAVDAGVAIDAGREVDAGENLDAGTAIDAGPAIDAGTGVDAGTGMDAGPMCPPTQTLCGGLCKDLQTDRFHCGMCGMVCGRGQMCCRGACRLGACL
jgi:hypothetical protein